MARLALERGRPDIVAPCQAVLADFLSSGRGAPLSRRELEQRHRHRQHHILQVWGFLPGLVSSMAASSPATVCLPSVNASPGAGALSCDIVPSLRRLIVTSSERKSIVTTLLSSQIGR